MRLVRGAGEGRQLLAHRRDALDVVLPSAVRQEILRIFGAELDAKAVVDRILADVRDEGDAAVRGYNEAIDGVPPRFP